MLDSGFATDESNQQRIIGELNTRWRQAPRQDNGPRLKLRSEEFARELEERPPIARCDHQGSTSLGQRTKLKRQLSDDGQRPVTPDIELIQIVARDILYNPTARLRLGPISVREPQSYDEVSRRSESQAQCAA